MQHDENHTAKAAEPGGFHLVGVGASAGGLEALEALFGAMPPDTGMAFIVLQHLSPDFESHMDALLGRQTAIPIRQVEDGMQVEPDTIYLAPAKQEMTITGGKLLLTDRDPAQGFSLPIDHFFRALAHDAGRHAIGIVLSGTGSDGSRGIRDIHAAGGLVLCQSVDTARFDGMPRNARETGVVDMVLAPETMPQALMRHAQRARGGEPGGEPTPGEHDGIHAILRLLRDEYGIDFAHYKPNTVARRVERRIAMAASTTMHAYVERLRASPEELSALYHDLLIGVTRFFRDREAFTVLEERIVPAIVGNTTAEDEIRVWVPGCATGEEAYSLAILLHEQLSARTRPLSLKIFGTDVHGASLDIAAAGRYPEQALADIEPRRRERYFRHDGEDGGQAMFRVTPELRQLLVFARHNVIRDAPFTRLHLISCRNLLIYLQPPAQTKVLSLFHFGLRTDGILLLGPSETPGQLADELESLDKRWKIYRKRRDIRLPLEARMPMTVAAPRCPPGSTAPDGARRPGERRLLALYDTLLDRYMPPGLLVDEALQLVHCFGGAERLLRLPGGRASSQVLDLLPGALRTPISGALRRAARERVPVRYTGLHANLGDGDELLELTVEPFHDQRAGATDFLISVHRRGPASAPEPASTSADVGQMSRDYIGSLETELRSTRESLQATIEELETANEELQATNEELVAANEELQSTNEELHSVNEELYTVNAEHQKHIAELTELNNDIDNLLHSLDVGVLFLDAELRIRKFTSAVATAFHLLPQDVGREFDGFAHNIEHPQLTGDIHDVLRTGAAVEREVVNRRGDFFFLRILPYRASAGVTGVVLTLIDIGTLKRSEASVRQLSAIVSSSADAIVATDPAGTITTWNRGAVELYGYAADEIMGRSISALVPEGGDSRTSLDRALRGESTDDIETVWLRKDGHAIELSMSLSPIRDAHDRIVGMSSIARDITRRKRAERQVQRAIEQRDHFLALLSHELRNPLMGLLTAVQLLDDPAAPAESRERAVAVIGRQSQQIARLLDDVLDVSRMRRDHIEMSKELIDLRGAAEAAVDAIRPRASRADVQVTTKLPGAPLWVHADRMRLRQLAAHLLTNAIKYTPPGKRVWLSLQRQRGRAVVRVEDEGVGIPPELRQSIFEPFVQSEEPPRGWEDGMGLGLALVRSIALAHGGEISVSSPGRDRGSEFVFRMPLAPAPALPAEATGAAGGEPGKYDILLVDDEEDNRTLLCEALAYLGYQVITAGTGEEAVRIIEETCPGVAIVDIGLPDISGYQVARLVRERLPDGKPYLIALTGFGQQKDREAATEAGFDEHLVKPVSVALLRKLIAEHTE